MNKPVNKTVADFLRTLEEQDLSLAEWARRKNLNMQAVYTVCSGRAQGKRGETRRAMKAMGLPLPPMHRAGKQVAHQG